jgi:hypothetical protein
MLYISIRDENVDATADTNAIHITLLAIELALLETL